MMNDKNSFHYTYSAKEQKEIEAIRKKYSTHKEAEDKLTQLRRLDAGVTQKPTIISLVFGIIGTLILGFGMSLIMTDICEAFGLYDTVALIVGVLVGIVGLFLISMAYPVYNRILKKGREKIAPEIIRLTDELMR